MKKHLSIIAICIFGLSLLPLNIRAQVTLYSEDFSNAALDNKGQFGNVYDMSGVTNWTINLANADGSWNNTAPKDRFCQISGYFESFNTDAPSQASAVVWSSSVIDISCYTNVTLSADLTRNSSNSGSGCAAYYSIDGGADVLFGSLINTTLVPASVSGLSGSTIQIKIRHWGSSSTPYYRHDNVMVVGTVSYPSLAPSGLLLSNYTGTSIDLNWTNGNGDKVLVLAKESSSILTDPAKGASYTANSVFGSGSQIGTGNYVVYDGVGTSVTITGLTSGVDYDFAVYAYNSACPWYNPNELFGSTLCTPPTTACSAASTSGITANSMQVNWTNGNGDATMVVAKASSALRTDPSIGTAYTANPIFGSGTQIGINNYVVYRGAGTNVVVSGLTSASTYDFAIYTYNSADNCYNLSEATVSGTTLTLAAPYEMDNINGSVISTCSGTFTDGGGAANYANNENYTATFCSASGQPLKFDFSSAGSFDIDVAGDSLFFYDGMTATGSPIAILTWLDDNNQTTYSSQLQVNTLSTCVTVKWKSNAAGVDAGWSATISCGAAPTCAANPPAADIFGQATAVCNIANYCGTTASYYGEDTPFNLIGGGTCPVPDDAIFGGTIENNSWLKFEALASSAVFNFSVSGGAACMAGIQVGVFAYNPTTRVFTLKSPCALTDGGQLGSFTLTASSLTIGETYYMMIDGNAGDQCDYTIGVNTGVVVVNAGIDQAVCTNSATISATSTINGGTWSVISGSGTFADATNPTTTVSGLALGPNVLRWTTTTDLCGSGTDDVTVTSSTCLPIELISLGAEYVAPNLIAVQWATATETNNDFFTIQRSNDGISFSNVGNIAGQGNSNSIHYYLVNDTVPFSLPYYYRIMQTDFDGSFSVSTVVLATPENEDGTGGFIVSPSSENGDLQIYFNAATDGHFSLGVYDVIGRSIFSQAVEVNKGMNEWIIDSYYIPTGVSFIVLQNSNQIFRQKHIQ